MEKVEKEQKTRYLESLRSLKESLTKLEEEGVLPSLLEQFREIVDEVNEWTKIVFEENKQVLQEWRENLSTDDDLVLLEHTECLMEEAARNGKYEDFLRLARLFHARNAYLKASDFSIWLELAPGELRSNAKELIDAFSLGVNYALGKACEIGKDPENLFLRTFHSVLSAHIQRLQRWEREKAERLVLMDKVKAITERYYRMGGTKRHHEFVKLFRKKPKYKEIGRKKMLKAVGKVAEPYGLKSGVKKAEST